MVIISKEEAFYTRALFFLFGVGLMMIAPRTPDLKANLQVNNGTLGSLISISAAGAFLALIYMGQIVHRFGARPVLIGAATWLYICMAIQPHIHSTWIFAIDQICVGMGWAGYHITINSQGLHRQKLSGIPILPKLHGTWSVGALLTAIIAIGITSHITLATHVDIGVSLIWVLTMYSIYRLRDVLIPGTTEVSEEDVRPSVKSIITFFKSDWMIVVAITSGVLLETSTNDWASLFTKEDIKASSSLSILSYVAFALGMIIGRLNIHTLYIRFTERQIIKRSAIVGGSLFIICVQIASHLAPHHPTSGLTFAFIAFLCGGLGSSSLAPGFTTIATRNSKFPTGFVVAQLTLVNTAIFFISRIIISWIAQATSITTALMIPGAVLFITAIFAKLGSDTVLTPR
jgi:MFS family permease